MLQRRKDVAFKREKALSQAFSQQVHFLHISLLPCFFFSVVRSSAYKQIDSIFSNPYQRYGETVGAHQWAMKVSSKKDHNGLITGCLQSRGTIAAEHEPQLIKETPSKL
jgi:hypothetical protein